MSSLTSFERNNDILYSCLTETPQSPALRLLCFLLRCLTESCSFSVKPVSAMGAQQWQWQARGAQHSCRELKDGSTGRCFLLRHVYLFSTLHASYISWWKRLGSFLRHFFAFWTKIKGKVHLCLYFINYILCICKLFALQNQLSPSGCSQWF